MAQVGPVGIPRLIVEVLDRRTRVRVTLNTQSLHQGNRLPRRLAEFMARAAVNGNDFGLTHATTAAVTDIAVPGARGTDGRSS